MPQVPYIPQKKVLTLLVVSIVISSAIGYVRLQVPYAKNLQITGVSFPAAGTIKVSGSVDIEFKNQEAWKDFGYKDGNFPYFKAWWEQQAAEKRVFSYDGVSVRLLFIDWELVQHYKNYDHLQFTIEVQLV